MHSNLINHSSRLGLCGCLHSWGRQILKVSWKKLIFKIYGKKSATFIVR